MELLRAQILAIGGFESPLIDTIGGAGELPAGCIGLLPNPGCIFTVITSSEDSHNHADANHMNLLTRNLGDQDTYAPCPIMVKPPYFFTNAVISAGSFRAILIRLT